MRRFIDGRHVFGSGDFPLNGLFYLPLFDMCRIGETVFESVTFVLTGLSTSSGSCF